MPVLATLTLDDAQVNKKGMCKVGTTLQISQHLRLDDGRLAVNNQGPGPVTHMSTLLHASSAYLILDAVHGA